MDLNPELHACRCYRYALRPSSQEWLAINRAQSQARRLWNSLVALLIWAEREQRNGRRESLIHEYGRILAGKSVTGAAVTKARKLMAERGLASVEEATATARAEQVEAARKYGRRRLALAYALERAQATTRNKRLCLSAQTTVAIIRKFSDACALYITGERGAPKFKVRGDAVSLQRQISPGTVPVDFQAGTVDLATLLGNGSCRAVRTILHRPLPAGATLKQLALTATASRAYVVFMVEAPAASFVRPVPEASPDAVAGIDPGRKTALSVASVDGVKTFTIQPPLFRDARFLRRQNRLLRKADRQLRQANPERFDDKGRWKRGGRKMGPLVLTKGLQRTRERVAEGQRHVAAARREAYHLGANRLLAEFSVVGVGNWRGRGKAPGVGGAKRAQNRKDYDNAVSEFVAILKDKAARCSQPRMVLDIREAGTTKNCPDCGKSTGPTGLKDLKVRAWTCSACGANHQRDFASARAIARRAQQQTASGAHPEQPEAKASNPVASPTKVRTKQPAKSPLTRKKASRNERRSGASATACARAEKVVGGGVVAKLARCSQPPVRHQPDLPLASPDAPRANAAACIDSGASAP